MRIWIAAVAGMATAPAYAAPNNPDCVLQSLSGGDRENALLGKTSDIVPTHQKAAVAKFDKLLTNCAKTNKWSATEASHIEQLNLWALMAESQQLSLSKYGIWPSSVKAAVDGMSQLILGERNWVLKKDQLLLAIEPGLASNGIDVALVKASTPARQAVTDIALSYANARQERIKLGLEVKLPGLNLPSAAPPPPMIAKVEPQPASPSPPPAAQTSAPPPPVEEPVQLVQIDYSPLIKDHIVPEQPWSCALYAMPGADREGWDASYNTPKRAQIEKARDAAAASCAAKFGWNADLQKEVAHYTEQWIMVGDLERFLLEEDIIYSERTKDIRKLADADLASAATLNHSAAFQKTIDQGILMYGIAIDDRRPTSEEIESIIRSHKLWAQLELFHRKHGVQQK